MPSKQLSLDIWRRSWNPTSANSFGAKTSLRSQSFPTPHCMNSSNRTNSPVKFGEVAVACRLRGRTMNDKPGSYAGIDRASESDHVFLTDDKGRKVGKKAFRWTCLVFVESCGLGISLSSATAFGPSLQSDLLSCQGSLAIPACRLRWPTRAAAVWERRGAP